MCTCIVAPTTTSSTSMPTTEQTTSKRTTTTSAKTTATTASAKTTTTSTTSITTTGSPTTHSAVRMCHTCGNANNSLPCDTRTIYLGNLQSCDPGEDFCMTDIVHDGSPYPKTFKRCVSEQECRNKWLHQTSDLDYCLQYGSVPMSGQYSCHFCCVGDGCNAGQIPDKSTYYSRA
ncbi:integumentary mucin C.1-like [Saccostrea cucullata]|uniref:integumentary mucin C.1-like n=1 Tax=Saccostrea cuccullata TaxID=36930 RepID=UPI002ED361EB